MGRHLKNKLYGNYRVLSINNEHMFNCNKRRINWYLNNNLATVVDDNTIKLNFIPNGPGHADDLFYLTYKENICVVCGDNEKLNRHHVIPRFFRRFFPDEIKKNSHHEVLLLCLTCHDKYEEIAREFKDHIAKKHGIILNGNGIHYDKNLVQMVIYARTLSQYWNNIPKNRRNEMIEPMKKYLNKNEISNEDIKEIIKIKPTVFVDDSVHHGKAILEKYDLQEFVEMWRTHFVDNMKPQYLPQYWDVKKSIYRTKP